jgi:hypothetical protein
MPGEYDEQKSRNLRAITLIRENCDRFVLNGLRLYPTAHQVWMALDNVYGHPAPGHVAVHKLMDLYLADCEGVNDFFDRLLALVHEARAARFEIPDEKVKLKILTSLSHSMVQWTIADGNLEHFAQMSIDEMRAWLVGLEQTIPHRVTIA